MFEINSGYLVLTSKNCVCQDWGFFVPYLTGSISLIVLAVGSVSPGYVASDIMKRFAVAYPHRASADVASIITQSSAGRHWIFFCCLS